ncbi:unnamed protein product [Caenorhabditis brenneri]
MSGLFPKFIIPVQEAFDQIRLKHPDATMDEDTIRNHCIGFLLMESTIKVNHIAIRAVSPPGSTHIKGGAKYKEKNLTFHWACYIGGQPNTGFNVVSCVDNHVTRQKHGRILNFDIGRYDYTREMWLDLQSCFPEGFDTTKTYFIPTPDADIAPRHQFQKDAYVKGMLPIVTVTPNGINSFAKGTQRFIKERFEEYLLEYHESKNPYYLARADFYRKLKVEHMSPEHVIVVGLASCCYIQNYFVEKMLRDAYTDKIESVI